MLSCAMSKRYASGDVTSGQSEGLSVLLLSLIYLGTWSVCTLGQVVLLPTGAAEWNVLEGF
jgi:hypothetical protein